jgi:hypothetical protein
MTDRSLETLSNQHDMPQVPTPGGDPSQAGRGIGIMETCVRLAQQPRG